MSPTRAAFLSRSLVAASALCVMPGCATGAGQGVGDDSSAVEEPLSAGQGIVFNTGGAGLNVRKTPSIA